MGVIGRRFASNPSRPCQNAEAAMESNDPGLNRAATLRAALRSVRESSSAAPSFA
jgi:hypothetical protein